jgi:hypothetical protein
MANATVTIPRADDFFDQATFARLLQLHVERPWVTTKESALLELVRLCGSVSDQELVLDLLRRFRYFQLADAEKHTGELATQAAQEWGLTPETTVWGCMSDPHHASSSHTMLNWCKNALAAQSEWPKECFAINGPVTAHTVQSGATIVLVDDFVGSGTTLERKCKWMRGVLQKRGVINVRIGLLALTVMEAARQVLGGFVDLAKVGEFQSRGISDYYNGAELASAVGSMLGLEGKLGASTDGRKFPSFGYKKSEALYGIHATSTPNNVFPVFWWPYLHDGNRRATILTRA